MSDKEVKESGEYDNFMDHIGETIHEAPSLADFVDVEDNRDNWENIGLECPLMSKKKIRHIKV